MFERYSRWLLEQALLKYLVLIRIIEILSISRQSPNVHLSAVSYTARMTQTTGYSLELNVVLLR